MEAKEGYEVPAPVSSSYCLSHEAKLTVEHKLLSLNCGRFMVKEGEGTLLFDVKCKDPLSWHKNRVLRDESGKPVLFVRSKCPSLRNKWAAYRGDDDSDDAKILFTIQKSDVFQFTPSFDIVLPTNVDSSTPDFTVKGNVSHTVYTVFHNGTPIAKSVWTDLLRIRTDEFATRCWPEGVQVAPRCPILMV